MTSSFWLGQNRTSVSVISYRYRYRYIRTNGTNNLNKPYLFNKARHGYLQWVQNCGTRNLYLISASTSRYSKLAIQPKKGADTEKRDERKQSSCLLHPPITWCMWEGCVLSERNLDFFSLTKCTHAGLMGSSNPGLIYALAMLNSFHHAFYCRLLIYPESDVAFSTYISPWSHATPVIQWLSTLDCDGNSLYHYTSGRWLWNDKEQLSRRYVKFNLAELIKIATQSTGSISCVKVQKLPEWGGDDGLCEGCLSLCC